MKKKEIIARFCKLSTKVNNDFFKFEFAADCFCGDNNISTKMNDFRFDEEIIKFIEDAVDKKLMRGGR